MYTSCRISFVNQTGCVLFCLQTLRTLIIDFWAFGRHLITSIDALGVRNLCLRILEELIKCSNLISISLSGFNYMSCYSYIGVQH